MKKFLAITFILLQTIVVIAFIGWFIHKITILNPPITFLNILLVTFGCAIPILLSIAISIYIFLKIEDY